MDRATRDGFGDALLQCAKTSNFSVLGADLAMATKTQDFKSKYPDRFVDVGIAEANMVGIASGMSEYGERIVISSFASFITGRYDIVRCSLALSEADVIVVGTHAGVAIGKDGVTQMGTEDLSLMLGLPNMRVYQPSTYQTALETTKYLLERKNCGPVYLRLGRQPVEEVYAAWGDGAHNADDLLYPYRCHSVPDTKDKPKTCVVSSGCIATEARALAGLIGCDWCDVVQLKPFVGAFLHGYEEIVTVEDHCTVGGLGDQVLRFCNEHSQFRHKVKKLGIPDEFAQSGDPKDLYKHFGLTPDLMFKDYLDWKARGTTNG